jgi:hypothetical protein
MAIYRKIYEEVEAARYVSGAKDALTIGCALTRSSGLKHGYVMEALC